MSWFRIKFLNFHYAGTNKTGQVLCTTWCFAALRYFATSYTILLELFPKYQVKLVPGCWLLEQYKNMLDFVKSENFRNLAKT